MKRLTFYLFFCGFTYTFLPSCKKDKPITDPSAKLSFSTDSILFDTVFSTLGSTTRLFKIYNTHNQPLVVSKAYISSGTSSQFRINIDGVPGPVVEDIELLPNDSLFVFVQVTVNPTNVNSPILIEDAIVFETNTNKQQVVLTAYGQDVYIHKPTVFPTDGSPAYSIINCSAAWTNDKPHLIFGTAIVNNGDVLTMNSGTKIFLNNSAILKVNRGGSLNINGAKDNEVTFQGIRLETDYKDIAGQWGKIWLSSGSINNIINWATLKNGSIGIQLDSLGSGDIPTLILTNTIIKNMAVAALYAEQGYINSYNCVFANSGQYSALLSNGGNYKFEHCTFANYWTSGSRTTNLLYLNNYSASATYNLDSAYFGNCIIYGSLNDEVGFDISSSGGVFNYTFKNCLIKTTLNMSNDGNHYNTITINADPLFTDTEKYDFTIKESSPAIDKGYNSSILNDLNNKPRPNPTAGLPDLGAYEYY